VVGSTLEAGGKSPLGEVLEFDGEPTIYRPIGRLPTKKLAGTYQKMRLPTKNKIPDKVEWILTLRSLAYIVRRK